MNGELSHSCALFVSTDALFQESGGPFAVLRNEGPQTEVRPPRFSARRPLALTHVFNRRSVSCCRTARPSGASSRPRSTSSFWSSTEGTFWTPGQVRQHRRASRQLTNGNVFFFCPAGEQNSKQGDENTLNGVFEAVMRVHYPAALGRIAVRTVPCPAVCVDAFSLVSK